MLLHLPIGFTDRAAGWPELRPLRNMVGNDDAVLGIVVALFTELAQQAAATGRVGWLPETSLQYLKTLRPEIGALFAEGALCVPGPNGEGWVCARFAELHPHLAPGYASTAEKGLKLGNFNKRMRRKGDAEQLALLLAPEKLAGADAEQCARALGFIYSLDCALGRSVKRLTNEDYPPALVAEALAAVKRHPVAQLDLIAEAVAGLYPHPALPNTAEALLPRLPAILELAPVQQEIARLTTRRKR